MSHTNPLPEQALLAARRFIKNGVALGYIRMPDADCPDPAHDTLPLIERALEAYDLGARSTAAQPVGPTMDERGWLIEHSGETPGTSARHVSWLRVRPKFGGYGAKEFGFTHDASDALRFARREDAEAVLAMHMGANPPDWYRRPYSVTEHLWPHHPAASGDSTPPSEPAVWPGAAQTWKWMTHPHWNEGFPIPVLLTTDPDSGEVWYQPFSTSCTDFEWACRDKEWAEVAAPVQGDPSGALRPEPEAVGQDRVRAWSEAPGAERVWTCKIGGPVAGIPKGSDSPMRAAVSQAFEQITGFEARFIFSGWGGELTEGERAVVENRPAMPTFEVRVAGPDDVFSYSDELFALRHANSVNQAYLADRAKHPDSEVLCVATVHAAEPPQAASGERGD